MQGNLGRHALLTSNVYSVLSAKVEADVSIPSALRNDLKDLAVVQAFSIKEEFP